MAHHRWSSTKCRLSRSRRVPFVFFPNRSRRISALKYEFVISHGQERAEKTLLHDVTFHPGKIKGKIKRSRFSVIAGGKVPGFIGRIVYTTKHIGFNSNLIQSIHFRFRIPNFRRRDQTGTFLFRIHPSACKRENEYATKMFRTSDESGKIPSRVNVV